LERTLRKIAYLRLTREDLLFAIHILSTTAQNPTFESVKALEWCLGNLKKTFKESKIYYSRKKEALRLFAFTDAAYSADSQLLQLRIVETY
jgi:hypothetical protein